MTEYNYRFYLKSSKVICIKATKSPSALVSSMEENDKYLAIIDIRGAWHTIDKSEIEYFVCEN